MQIMFVLKIIASVTAPQKKMNVSKLITEKRRKPHQYALVITEQLLQQAAVPTFCSVACCSHQPHEPTQYP